LIASLGVTGPEGKKIKAEIEKLIPLAILDAQPAIAAATREAFIVVLEESERFSDNLEAGFLRFADSFEDTGQATAQFFADILSDMSRSFEDLFFNVLTGKFDDLADIAKNTFEAILRSAITLFTRLAAQQIVLNISGNITATGGGAGGILNSLGGIGSLINKIPGVGGFLGGALGFGGGGSALGGAPVDLFGSAGFGVDIPTLGAESSFIGNLGQFIYY